jgi:hypothetical protein
MSKQMQMKIVLGCLMIGATSGLANLPDVSRWSNCRINSSKVWVNGYKESVALLNKTKPLIQKIGSPIQIAAIESYTSAFQKVLNTRSMILQKKLSKLFDSNAMTVILMDPEMSFFHKRISEVLSKFEMSTQLSEEKLHQAFSELLKDRVPNSQIEERVGGLFKASVTADKYKLLRRALGELDLQDVQLLTHGGNPLHPTKESLLGQYLERTGAQSMIKKFPIAPGSTTLGPSKLVVAIDMNTFHIYKELFANENFYIHYHTPRQGTLMMSFEDKVGTYSSLNNAFDNRVAQLEGTILPHILLKTTESQRLKQFTELASLSSATQRPWEIKNYCKKGGYTSCTHWVGNIPIGDELVSQYKFPGNVDAYAGNAIDQNPQISDLGDYVNNPLNSRTNYLMSRVWRPKKGSMQLSEVLGPKELQANLDGEYANPGWVAYRLVGNVSIDRVPVIFRFVENSKAPMDADMDPIISAY